MARKHTIASTRFAIAAFVRNAVTVLGPCKLEVWTGFTYTSGLNFHPRRVYEPSAGLEFILQSLAAQSKKADDALSPSPRAAAPGTVYNQVDGQKIPPCILPSKRLPDRI